MERLTSCKSEQKREMICRYEDCDTCEEYCPDLNTDNCQCLQEILEKLAEYEDLEEQGKLLKLPCTPGQSVWVIKNEKISKCVVSTIRIEESGVSFCNATYICNLSDFGRTVFRTKEEAEAELIKKTNRRKCNELEKRRKSEEKTMRLIRFMRGEEI